MRRQCDYSYITGKSKENWISKSSLIFQAILINLNIENVCMSKVASGTIKNLSAALGDKATHTQFILRNIN
jgi:hypothetical protein